MLGDVRVLDSQNVFEVISIQQPLGPFPEGGIIVVVREKAVVLGARYRIGFHSGAVSEQSPWIVGVLCEVFGQAALAAQIARGQTGIIELRWFDLVGGIHRTLGSRRRSRCCAALCNRYTNADRKKCSQRDKCS
ncbi:MAG: hypothetical protein CMH89_02415 [Oceanicaulis sp.]|nr:hypothetical protein [Oceanicaulis sp.]